MSLWTGVWPNECSLAGCTSASSSHDTFLRRVLSCPEEAFILMGILMLCVRTWTCKLDFPVQSWPCRITADLQGDSWPWMLSQNHSPCLRTVALHPCQWVSGLPLAHLPLQTSPSLKAVWQVDWVGAKCKILSLKAAPKQWRREPPLRFLPVLQNSSYQQADLKHRKIILRKRKMCFCPWQYMPHLHFPRAGNSNKNTHLLKFVYIFISSSSLPYNFKRSKMSFGV